MANDYGYDDDYMAGEDEWDREQLLDPAWEKQQKKVCPFLNFYAPFRLFSNCKCTVTSQQKAPTLQCSILYFIDLKEIMVKFKLVKNIGGHYFFGRWGQILSGRHLKVDHTVLH
jgi:hypothetical protein